MPKTIKKLAYGSEAMKGLKDGVDKVANAVKTTLGPRGQNVLMENTGTPPTSTKDGVTVARSITLLDKYEDMGASLVKEVASKTESSAGDGTTTSAILMQALLNAGMNSIEAGANPVQLKRELSEALKHVDAELESESIEATPEQLRQVATISANDPIIGGIIAGLYEKIGKDGVVSVEQSQGTDIETEVVKGLQIDKGYISPYFITDTERGEVSMKDVNVFVTDFHFMTQEDIIPIMMKLKEAGREKNGTLIIAEELSGEALGALVVNKLRGAFPCVAVKAPSFGERRSDIMRDIAKITGTEVISFETGRTIESITAEDFGIAESITVRKDDTIILGDQSQKKEVEKYTKGLEKQLESSSAKYDIEYLERRIAKLKSGVAMIRVGAHTETELKEIAYRIDDSVAATKSAIQEGILVGGGLALFRAREVLKELDTDGAAIMRTALDKPLRLIAQNGGYSDQDIVRQIEESGFTLGFNAEEGIVTDLMEAGIVDATKVVRTALVSAVTTVGLILITGTLIAIEEPEERKND